jgi:hypothetical protein
MHRFRRLTALTASIRHRRTRWPPSRELPLPQKEYARSDFVLNRMQSKSLRMCDDGPTADL